MTRGYRKGDDSCGCGLLDRGSQRPDSPIRFDPATSEFHFVHGDGARLIIYYCPFCGGKAPPSQRAALFHRISEAERERLLALVKRLRSLEDIVGALGPADYDDAAGLVTITPERDGQPETIQPSRVLKYSKLSSTANVVVYVGHDASVSIRLEGKPRDVG